jgi:hypothetical protein
MVLSAKPIGQGWRTYDTCAQNDIWKFSMAQGIYCCPMFLFLLPDERLYIAKNIYIYIYIYKQKSGCVEIVFELTFLLNRPNNSSETFLHKSGAVRIVDWMFITSWPRQTGDDWMNTWHWKKCFVIFFSTGSINSPTYFQVLFLTALLEEAFIINIIY